MKHSGSQTAGLVHEGLGEGVPRLQDACVGGGQAAAGGLPGRLNLGRHRAEARHHIVHIFSGVPPEHAHAAPRAGCQLFWASVRTGARLSTKLEALNGSHTVSSDTSAAHGMHCKDVGTSAPLLESKMPRWGSWCTPEFSLDSCLDAFGDALQASLAQGSRGGRLSLLL